MELAFLFVNGHIVDARLPPLLAFSIAWLKASQLSRTAGELVMTFAALGPLQIFAAPCSAVLSCDLRRFRGSQSSGVALFFSFA